MNRRPIIADAPIEDACDPDLERAILAAVLLDTGEDAVLARLAPLVREEDFYDPRHAVIWTAMTRIGARGEPIDVHTVVAELRVTEKIHTVGGPQYIGELTDCIPTIAHCEAHARLLADLADLRAARSVLDGARLLARGSVSRATVPDVLSRVRVELAKMPDGQRRGEKTTLDAHATRAHAEVTRARTTALAGRMTAASWDIRQMDGFWRAGGGFVDGIPGPLAAGQLIGLAAPGGAGKTSLAWQLSENVARAGRRVRFFAGEMNGTELVKRRAAQLAGVSQARLRAGAVSDEELAAVESAMSWLASLPIDVVALAGMSAHDVRNQMLAAKAKDDLALVVVDFVQMIPLPGTRSERVEEYDRIYTLKGGAVDCEVPLVAISAMTKGAQRETSDGARLPTIQDAMGSGAEFACDVMMFLVREPGKPGERPREVGVKAYVTKNRGGEGANVHADLILNLPRGEFRDADMADDAPVADDGRDGMSEFGPMVGGGDAE